MIDSRGRRPFQMVNLNHTEVRRWYQPTFVSQAWGPK